MHDLGQVKPTAYFGKMWLNGLVHNVININIILIIVISESRVACAPSEPSDKGPRFNIRTSGVWLSRLL